MNVIDFFKKLLFLLSLFTLATADCRAANSNSLEKSINYLISFVEKSDVKFVRNGDNHTGAEAAKLMRYKYEHNKSDIKTPEDFIRIAGTKSSTTGRAYYVLNKDGTEITSAEWLKKILEEYRKRLAVEVK